VTTSLFSLINVEYSN